MNKEDYMTPKEASKKLGVHWQTLRNWDANGSIETIRTPGGKRMYNVKKYLIDNNLIKDIQNITSKKKICYCRVSTLNQKSNLQNQINLMKKKYPNHEIIQDVASGLNFNRPGLNKIISLALNKELEEVVVMYKDRLARFGFELIENIIKNSSQGKIVIINNNDESPEEELTKDLVSIINVFSAKLNGMRKYKNKLKENSS
jgi:excisionase family DNA binding protein